MATQQCRQLLLATLLAVGATPAIANTCNQLSPLKEESGDGYWDVEAMIELANMPNSSHAAEVSKASSDHADAVRLLELFDKRNFRTVSGIRVDCRGAGASIRQLEYESTLRLADYSKKVDGAYYLRFTEKLANERETGKKNRKVQLARGSWSTKKSVIVDLPAVSEWLVHADNKISTSQINRRRNANGFSYIQQTDTVLQQTDEGVRLSQTFYVNGHRATWATWTIAR